MLLARFKDEVCPADDKRIEHPIVSIDLFLYGSRCKTYRITDSRARSLQSHIMTVDQRQLHFGPGLVRRVGVDKHHLHNGEVP